MRNRQLDFPLMVLIAVLLFGWASTATVDAFQGKDQASQESEQTKSEKKSDANPKSPVAGEQNDNQTPNPESQTKQTEPDDSSTDETPKSNSPLDESKQDESKQKESSQSTDQNTATEGKASGKNKTWFQKVAYPLITLGIGIVVVLGLIIGFKINAFLALICAAIVVSVMAPGGVGQKISRVADALGDAVGGIGIVIALAAIIGKCMLDSGGADRIVRSFVGLFGEKRAQFSLLGSGFVLAVPVFFDTVFYLLVPLARSLHRRTKVKYLLYILAIGAGGAITHTLVPPTPGPLLMAANLGVSIGTMMMVGALVAFPAAIAGLIFGAIADRIMQTPMRELPGSPEGDPIPDEELPPLWLSLAPVVIPVVLISLSTIMTSLADSEGAARFRVSDIDSRFFGAVQTDLNKEGPNVGKLIVNHKNMGESTPLLSVAR